MTKQINLARTSMSVPQIYPSTYTYTNVQGGYIIAY